MTTRHSVGTAVAGATECPSGHGLGCGDTEGISPVSPAQPCLLEAAGAWLDPPPALCPTEREVRGRRCCAHALHISNHDMTSMELWRTGIKRRKKPFSAPPEASATEDWDKLLIHRLCPSSAHPVCARALSPPRPLGILGVDIRPFYAMFWNGERPHVLLSARVKH